MGADEALYRAMKAVFQDQGLILAGVAFDWTYDPEFRRRMKEARDAR